MSTEPQQSEENRPPKILDDQEDSGPEPLESHSEIGVG